VINGTLYAQDAVSLNGALSTGPGSTITIEGNPSYGAASLIVANGFTNNGTIQLTEVGGSYGSGLTLTNGNLVNAPGGTLNALLGFNGLRTLAAQLDNRGSVISAGTSGFMVGRPGDAHVNTGSITATAGNFNVSSASASFSNQGLITLG